MDLQNSVSIVTGASTGIGRAIGLAIAMKGGQVALVGRNVDGLKQTEKMILNNGGKSKIFPTDLREKKAIEKLATDVKEVFGNADIVINVAGVWHNQDRVFYGPHLEDTPVEEIENVFNVNIRAPIMLTRLFIPGMIQKKRGKIINISGTFSSGGAGWLHYYVSKQALEHFTFALADELRNSEIQVNCISPSDVATDALKKYFPEDAITALKPDDVANLAIWLLSDEVADNITRQVLVIKSKIAHP